MLPRRIFSVFILLPVGLLMCSCGTAPRVSEGYAAKPEKADQAARIVLVSEAGRCLGLKFRETFLDTLTGLTQGSGKKLSIMTDFEYYHSPYQQSKERGLFPDTLFIFLKIHSCEQNRYVSYHLEAGYFQEVPFMIKTITFDAGYSAVSMKYDRARELAHTVVEELKAQNIL